MKIISRKMIIQKHKHVILFYVERLKFRKKFVSRKSVMYVFWTIIFPCSFLVQIIIQGPR